MLVQSPFLEETAQEWHPFQRLHLDAEEENAYWCIFTVSLLGHLDGEDDQVWPLRHKRNQLTIWNTSRMWDPCLEHQRPALPKHESTQQLPNPFNFHPVSYLGFRKPEAQSKGKLQHHFRS